jgi:hypothetical protein
MANLSDQRQALLDQMAQIQTMAQGALSEQFFTRTRRGRKVRLGPYYKLQLWHEGKNTTRYVHSDQVPALREAIANHQHFEDLCQKFVQLTVAMTQEAQTPEAKKKLSRKAK